jgi:hypothetical protein
MSAIIYSGDRLKAFRQAIQLSDAGATLASGAVDPTVTNPGLILTPGSVYLSTSTGKLYVKRTTTGNDTNYDTIPQITGILAANRILVTDAAGNVITDTELIYDSAANTFTAVNVVATTAQITGLTASLPVKTDGFKNLISSQILNADVDNAADIALTKLAPVTASRALQSDVSGNISASTVTSTELGYVSGVGSSIQSQFAGKVAKAGDSMTGDLVMGGNKVTSLGAPSAATDAVNKGYVDGLISGLKWKDPVSLIAISNITLSGLQTIDGVLTVAGDRVLVAGQTTGSQNGIYIAASGAWARSTDLPSGSSAANVAVFISDGTVFADTGRTCTNNVASAVVGTNSLVFVQFTSSGDVIGGVGLLRTGNTLDVNMGAGITELPTDEVGIDLLSASGLMLTVDGSTPSTVTAAQLAVRVNGATIDRTASGIKVADASLTNTQISPSAAIDYSKLNLTGSVINADVSPSAAIVYSKLSLANSILNADINTAAGIVYSKLSLANSIVNSDINTAAAIAYAKLNLTGSVVNADIGAAAAIAYSKLNLTTSIVNADIATAASIARTKLASATANTFVTNDASGVIQSTSVTASRAVATDVNGLPVAAATTATELGFVSGVTSAIQTQFTGKVSKTGDTMSGALNMGSQLITNLATPVSTTDAANKTYVDTAISGLNSFSDALFRVTASGDATKKIALSATAITTATTRTITMPNANVDLGLVATAIQRAGTVPFTANQPMGTFKLTGLGAGTGVGDSVRFEQAILVTGTNAFTAAQSMGGFLLTNLATPVSTTDATTKAYVDAGDSSGSTSLTLAAAGTITITATHTHQVVNVQGTAAGVVTLATAPFGAGPFKNGQLITLIGNSNTNIVRIGNNDIAKGTIMNASWDSNLYDSITFAYASTPDRFVEISRNN